MRNSCTWNEIYNYGVDKMNLKNFIEIKPGDVVKVIKPNYRCELCDVCKMVGKTLMVKNTREYRYGNIQTNGCCMPKDCLVKI